MRIERHHIGAAAPVAAEADFAARIAGDVHRMRHDEHPASGWRSVAGAFLDYLGARSLGLPELGGKDARVAFGSAAAAAVGALELTLFPGRPLDVFIDYAGAGVTYCGEFERGAEDGRTEGNERAEQAARSGPGEQGRRGTRLRTVRSYEWLDGLYLAVVAQVADRCVDVFVDSAPPWRGNEGRADVALVHALMAYVFGHEEGPDRVASPGPVHDIEKCALIDMVVATLGEGDDWPGHRAALNTLRALAAGDEEKFTRCLATQLKQYRGRFAGQNAAPRTLLPLDAMALMALAHRRHGWPVRIESGYLPRTVVTGFAPPTPRVRAHGRDKRADAVAELAAGALVVERPVHPLAKRPVYPAPYDDLAAQEMARFHDPAEDPKVLARDLTSLMADQRRRFLARAARAPGGTDPRQYEALLLGAEAGAGALRVARAEPGTEVQVTIGGTSRTLPAWRGSYRPNPHQWQQAMSLVLVVGARGPLADCVLIEPEFFAEGDQPSPGGAYCAALHDYLRGVDPEPAMDHALETAARMAGGSFLAPPAVLLSQLVEGDQRGFALALADALEEHREHFEVGERGKEVEAAVDLDVLGLACHAHRIGWPVPVRSPYLPEGLLR
ncbi:immunity 49 family protein [Streptomyces sp. NBC_00083]|uniref:immunity 49 family protein n=1 Tax=Streptomyces sp. NBC_00083 TaxID=2975647 RepID=UPI00225264B7|nr:immunity 49 family protein [Streptomyces sp. NBC_00083]MCX5384236.1 immunity 49 family protein [Streptomyces sp. NBC_00083]